MPEEQKSKDKDNKLNIYTVAFLLFVLGNFAFETLLAFVENQQQTDLQPIVPFTRIYLLIITALLANYYIRRKQGMPKQKLWWRVLKSLILFVIAWLFFFGAWFSVSDAELERMRQDRPEIPNFRNSLPESSTLEVTE